MNTVADEKRGSKLKNVLEFLEKSARLYPDKAAFFDLNISLTYKELLESSQKIGSALTRLNKRGSPVAIYFDKSPLTVSAMLGVAYSGNFYTVIDSESPASRINNIFETLKPICVITDKKYAESAKELSFCGETLLIEDLLNADILQDRLGEIRALQTDADILYALYTSGSTGLPKGAVISHKSVIAYTKWVSDAFDITDKTVFANQTPFYFSMSVTDVFSTIKNGASLGIIPKAYFSFPLKLVEFMNNYAVNTIYWVPSALSIVANFDVFSVQKPVWLKKVMFAGEVMPVKQLNYWIKNLPHDVLFANLYGPTETTDICTYYVVNREFDDGDSLPIGTHCDNCAVMIINENGEEAKPGEEGELYVKGSFLANGYYNAPEKTAEAFVQNPLNKSYPETVYKTGDLVRMNERGELVYITRKDFQIKRMGYRIELGEIEACASSMERMKECACVYSKEKDLIVLFYSASKTGEEEVASFIRNKLPAYLQPDKCVKISSMPKNQNGKTDRLKLSERI